MLSLRKDDSVDGQAAKANAGPAPVASSARQGQTPPVSAGAGSVAGAGAVLSADMLVLGESGTAGDDEETAAAMGGLVAPMECLPMYFLTLGLSEVNAVCASEDGLRVVVVGDENDVSVWSLRTKTVQEDLHHDHEVLNAVVWKDEFLVLAGDGVSIWDGEEELEPLALLDTREICTACDIRVEGEVLYVLVGDEMGNITEFNLPCSDVSTPCYRKRWIVCNDHAVSDILFSPQGTYIALASADCQVSVYTRKGELGHVDFDLPPLTTYAHRKMATSCAWSNSEHLLASTGLDGQVLVYAVSEEEVVHAMQPPSQRMCWACAWNPHTEYLAVATDTSCFIYDMRDFRLIDVIDPHSDTVYTVQWLPNHRGAITVLTSARDGSIALSRRSQGAFLGSIEPVTMQDDTPLAMELLDASFVNEHGVLDLRAIPHATSIHMAPNGRDLLAVYKDEGVIIRHNLYAQRSELLMRHRHVCDAVWHPEVPNIVAFVIASHCTILIWDVGRRCALAVVTGIRGDPFVTCAWAYTCTTPERRLELAASDVSSRLFLWKLDHRAEAVTPADMSSQDAQARFEDMAAGRTDERRRAASLARLRDDTGYDATRLCCLDDMFKQPAAALAWSPTDYILCVAEQGSGRLHLLAGDAMTRYNDENQGTNDGSSPTTLPVTQHRTDRSRSVPVTPFTPGPHASEPLSAATPAAQEIRTQPRLDNELWNADSAVWLPSGSRVMIGCSDFNIRILDLALVVVGTLSHHRTPVRTMYVSPMGNRVLSMATDNEIAVWDGDGTNKWKRNVFLSLVLNTHISPRRGTALGGLYTQPSLAGAGAGAGAAAPSARASHARIVARTASDAMGSVITALTTATPVQALSTRGPAAQFLVGIAVAGDRIAMLDVSENNGGLHFLDMLRGLVPSDLPVATTVAGIGGSASAAAIAASAGAQGIGAESGSDRGDEAASARAQRVEAIRDGATNAMTEADLQLLRSSISEFLERAPRLLFLRHFAEQRYNKLMARNLRLSRADRSVASIVQAAASAGRINATSLSHGLGDDKTEAGGTDDSNDGGRWHRQRQRRRKSMFGRRRRTVSDAEEEDPNAAELAQRLEKKYQKRRLKATLRAVQAFSANVQERVRRHHVARTRQKTAEERWGLQHADSLLHSLLRDSFPNAAQLLFDASIATGHFFYPLNGHGDSLIHLCVFTHNEVCLQHTVNFLVESGAQHLFPLIDLKRETLPDNPRWVLYTDLLTLLSPAYSYSAYATQILAANGVGMVRSPDIVQHGIHRASVGSAGVFLVGSSQFAPFELWKRAHATYCETRSKLTRWNRLRRWASVKPVDYDHDGVCISDMGIPGTPVTAWVSGVPNLASREFLKAVLNASDGGLFDAPILRMIFEYRWRVQGHKLFVIQLLGFLFFVCVVTGVLIMSAGKHPSELNSFSRQVVNVWARLLLLALSIWWIRVEVAEFLGMLADVRAVRKQNRFARMLIHGSKRAGKLPAPMHLTNVNSLSQRIRVEAQDSTRHWQLRNRRDSSDTVPGVAPTNAEATTEAKIAAAGSGDQRPPGSPRVVDVSDLDDDIVSPVPTPAMRSTHLANSRVTSRYHMEGGSTPGGTRGGDADQGRSAAWLSSMFEPASLLRESSDTARALDAGASSSSQPARSRTLFFGDGGAETKAAPPGTTPVDALQQEDDAKTNDDIDDGLEPAPEGSGLALPVRRGSDSIAAEDDKSPLNLDALAKFRTAAHTVAVTTRDADNVSETSAGELLGKAPVENDAPEGDEGQSSTATRAPGSSGFFDELLLVSQMVDFLSSLPGRAITSDYMEALVNYVEPFNILDWCIIVLSWLTNITHVLHPSREPPIAALLVVAAWGKLLFYATAFRGTAPIVHLLTLIVQDITFVVAITLIFSISFGYAFRLLDIYPTVVDSLLATFSILLGDFQLSDFQDSKFSILATTLFIVYAIVATLMLLNSLIAIMGDSFARMSVTATNEFHRQRAGVLLQMEALSSKADEFLSILNPTYVHMLLPNNANHEDATSTTTSEYSKRMHSMQEHMEGALEQAREETAEELRDLSAKVQLLSDQVTMLSHSTGELLHAMKQMQHTKAD